MKKMKILNPLSVAAGSLVAVAMVFMMSGTVCAKTLTSFEQAKKEALKKVKNATITEIDKDYENGKLVYEIEMIKGQKSYDLVYRAEDGKLISYSWEERYGYKKSNKKMLSKSKVRKLAAKKVSGGKITSIKKEREDGIYVYEVKMTRKKTKYTLEYHARTGKLLKYKWKLAQSKASQSENYIGIEGAKKVALSKFPGAMVLKVEFDYDDGVPVYEVEIFSAPYVYELKIHARTGKILEMEMDS